MDQRLLGESEEVRDYIEYPEVEIITSNCCGCKCCCKVAYFPIQKLTFIGHWRKSLSTPIIVGIFYIITIASYFFDTYNTFPDITNLILSYFFTVFSFVCFIFGYYLIIIKGPGYVPYNWLKTHQRSYTWEESMKNIAIYNDQVKFARLSPDKPKRSCFSKDARRFVLRADHYSKLGKSWIGLKNYRYFLLTCLYCFIFAISIVLSRFWLYAGLYRYYKTEKNNSINNTPNFYYNNYHQNNLIKNKYVLDQGNSNQIYSNNDNRYQDYNFDSKNRNDTNDISGSTYNMNIDNNFNDNKKFKFRIWYALGILTTLIAFFFGITSLFTFYRNLYNLSKNVTAFELMTKKHATNWDRGCIRNFEEVCGPKKYILFWPFPFVCLEPMENGFYDEALDQNNYNFDSVSQSSREKTMDSLY